MSLACLVQGGQGLLRGLGLKPGKLPLVKLKNRWVQDPVLKRWPVGLRSIFHSIFYPGVVLLT